MLDDKLTMPIKCQSLLKMFNSINVVQTKYYIKIDCHTYFEKLCKKKSRAMAPQATPLPTDKVWFKKFNVGVGSSDPKQVAKLESMMQVEYC
jgi:hypothetical protein